MKILLCHNKTYYPALGGGDKSNRELMEALTRAGHRVQVMARMPKAGEEGQQEFVQSLVERDVEYRLIDGAVEFEHQGVAVATVTMHPNLRAYLIALVDRFQPDIIVTSTDDPAHILLEAAFRTDRPVVFLARATLALPFGPDCAFPSESKTENLRQCDAIVCVSNYVANYIREHTGIPAVFKPIALQGEGPFPHLGKFDNPFVTMVNPCGVKGLPIFAELARRMPQVKFAAVPTWGTIQEDLDLIASCPNMSLMPAADNINDILQFTRVMMVPSLWAEARSRIVVESMLRGVPVIASKAGGLIEAKMGVDYLIPVRLIEKYKPQVNEQMVPLAEIPDQNIDPWQAALHRLVTDRDHYQELSQRSREVALNFKDNFDLTPFLDLLQQLMSQPLRRQAISRQAKAPTVLDRLTPERRALLALRLKQNAAAPIKRDLFVVNDDDVAAIKLFCFPYAGGGTTTYRSWRNQLKDLVQIVAAQLPGREARASETPYPDLATAIEDLAIHIRPLMQPDTVFFGHSMGSGLAFELIRELRRTGSQLPKALLVSGARAPQFRRNYQPGPDPTDEELLAQLRRLEGIPAAMLDRPELLAPLLPVIKADTSLYRKYVYQDEPPLQIPIFAFGGTRDANVEAHHLEAWAQQTSKRFEARFFEGGHFYLQDRNSGFLEALRQVLHGLD
jgi:surfactin synthase thioesterase subunit/glycosyltransferase involved in cell wall biosynthesis